MWHWLIMALAVPDMTYNRKLQCLPVFVAAFSLTFGVEGGSSSGGGKGPWSAA